MPESKGRSKPAYIPPRTAQKDQGPNPRWYVPLMLGLMVVGLIWVVTYYISGVEPVPRARARALEPRRRLRPHALRVPHDDPVALSSDVRLSTGLVPTGDE